MDGGMAWRSSAELWLLRSVSVLPQMAVRACSWGGRGGRGCLRQP